jgi:hypothetical protein
LRNSNCRPPATACGFICAGNAETSGHGGNCSGPIRAPIESPATGFRNRPFNGLKPSLTDRTSRDIRFLLLVSGKLETTGFGENLFPRYRKFRLENPPCPTKPSASDSPPRSPRPD